LVVEETVVATFPGVTLKMKPLPLPGTAPGVSGKLEVVAFPAATTPPAPSSAIAPSVVSGA
jgi:hypothetical protein